MRIAVVTSVAWKSLPKRVKELQDLLSKHLPDKLEIIPILKDLGKIPTDKNGRVLGSWLKKNIKTEYDGACLLFERSQADNLKLGLKGHYFRDEDGYVEFWVCSKEKQSGGKFDKKRLDKFEHTFIHELAHGLYHWIGFSKTDDDTSARPNMDNTHYWDDKGKLEIAYKEIKGAWKKPTPPVSLPKSPLDGLVPKLKIAAEKLVETMASLGKPIRITEGFRSMERQAELYAQGRTKPGNIVTNAKPGQSRHNFGEAIDVVFKLTGYNAPQADWELLGATGEALGLSWGGRWKGFVDLPHFEVK